MGHRIQETAIVHKTLAITSTLAVALILGSGRVSVAAEGAWSNYFPGSYGTVAVAISPAPGWSFLNYSLFYVGGADLTMLQGRLNTDLDTSSFVNMSTPFYLFDKPVFGAQFALAAFVPLGYVGLETQLVSEAGSRAADDSVTALGDIILMPASFFWNKGNWYFNLYELMVTPTGEYDVDNVVNLGRNYWSFDTVFAVTNLNMKAGRDFSFVAGYMVNTTNNATDYRTGNELHVEAVFNQFLSETFALGVHGYFYDQVTGDSGSGAILGPFEGEAYGIGPSFLWTPKSGGGKFSITGTWLHDLHTTNRLKGDSAVVTLAWQFGVSANQE